ncbi:MAG: DNA translocase FtsK 4TM domain-containing protein [Endomicrobiales bacterium]|nr:DNA translocase FtsK 4TM domain-containing protein [Endomicrobiales bacterium]
MYFRVKAKSKKRDHRQLKGILLFAVSFFLAYCLVLPSQVGAVGTAVYNILAKIFGNASYLIPLIIFWFGLAMIRTSYQLRTRLDVIWSVLLMFLASTFFVSFGHVFYGVESEKFGGWIGMKLYPFFWRLFGGYVSLAITFFVFIYVLSLFLRISLREIMRAAWHKIAEDYRQWQEARRELQRSAPPKIKAPAQGTIGQEPRIEQRQQEFPQMPKITKPAAAEKEEMPKPSKKIPVPAAAPTAKQPAEQPAPVAYSLPSIEMLHDDRMPKKQGESEHLANAELLTKILADFDISAKVVEIIPGPVVTRYDIELAPGIKIQSVINLSDNIALAMKSPSIRIVPIPEKAAVGIEVPNENTCVVGLKGILSSEDYVNSESLLTLAFGKTTDGTPYVADLAPMPHLLIAGATGSGKSVGIHSIILSILYKARPDEVKFLMIDPKRLELPVYRGLPHIYDPRVPPEKAEIVTQPKEAAESLKKLVKVMESRYEKFAKEMVRNIEAYNEKMAQTGGKKEFYIVVIIDELADLMLIATRDVEDSIQRLAQMARAVGIHLVLATQRPSVDVITGVIKANFPCRIAFQTTSKVDSRVILDSIGADALLGRGDMLFLPSGEAKPIRLQGAFVSPKEAEQVVSFIRRQNIPPQYEFASVSHGAKNGNGEDDDELREELVMALKLVQERKRVSQDLLKAHFGSSARATNLLSLLETKGFIHKPEGTNRWTIYFEKINDYLSTASAGTQD